MWPNKYGFNNGDSPNNMNPNGFPISSFAGSPGSEQQQYFPVPQQYNQDQHGEGYPNFQPPIGISNEQMFMHNQMTSSPMAQFPSLPPTQYNIPQPSPSSVIIPTQINARAAELKAQLLKGRARRTSNNSPATMAGQATKQQNGLDQPNSSLQNPTNSVATGFEQEHNINELISQYSESNPTAGAKIKQGKENINAPRPSLQRSSTTQSPAIPPARSSAGSTKLAKLFADGGATNTVTNDEAPRATQTYNASSAEMSEGEIVDEAMELDVMPATKPKESRVTVPQGIARTRNSPIQQASATKPNNGHDDSLIRNSLPYRPPSRTPSRTVSRMVRPDTSPSVSHKDISSRQDKIAEADNKNNRGVHPDLDKPFYPYSRSQDHNKELRRPEVTSEQTRKGSIRPSPETARPTLTQLLPYDRDLKDWLELTGYFNIPSRDKILKRRRAIAELDEQRQKLVAELEADERGPTFLAPHPRNSSPVMAVSPYVKTDTQAEPLSMSKRTEYTPPHDRVVSNKRSYGNIKDPHVASGPMKLQRIDGHPITSGRDSPHESLDHRIENGPSRPRFADAHGRFRSPSPMRGRSPEWRDRRSPSPRRMKSYDRLDESGFRPGRERPYEVRGGYRGRAYDPNFRRGRGSYRGRGDSHLDSRTDGSYGTNIANGRPFKDPQGFKRGGKGDTRYFIIKSFNEENVQRCIEDGVWTTQLQNGSILSEAFNTCKNVILVFSINKSKAFQGYARMESVPGSVEVPDWQKGINWETAGPFRVRWLVICTTTFHRVRYLKNALNENQAVFVGKDGQEIEGTCGTDLVGLMDEEAEEAVITWSDRYTGD